MFIIIIAYLVVSNKIISPKSNFRSSSSLSSVMDDEDKFHDVLKINSNELKWMKFNSVRWSLYNFFCITRYIVGKRYTISLWRHISHYVIKATIDHGT